MRILVLGAGALGGYFGGRLLEAGAELAFLVRPKRQAQLRERGLVLRCPATGELRRPVTALTAAELRPGWDIVLLSCKAYDLEEAIDSLRPAIGPETAVLPVLNGLSHLDRLREAFGAGAVLGGLAKIRATLNPAGEVINLSDWRYLTLGELDGSLTPRVTRFAELARQGGILAEAVPDIHRAMWAKLVHLGTVAAATVLLRGSTGQIARAPGGTAFLLTLLERNMAIAAHHGHPVPAGFAEEYRALLSDPTGTYTASMLRDLESGGRIEADHILGFLLQAAGEAGVDPTLHAIAYLHAKTYEQRRAEEKAA
ncbi:ketopantoate reductase family protein [Pseudoroseomonas cervicalis]|uniref:ketopantoate reductase family protein n=1 Tax=Teichococcus cervicalis TaxID=204525 RepID=UPI0027834C6E|nr:ketopantoate reductase family protein [Pseudoroseomonas cervicalis]MDQ1080970.1 2-dehydropantoate 2-reductase [Pseudoroseomonas cervicalis]